MFASCLYEKFACAVWSDGGVVFDEARSNVNYWEPWYLGLDPAQARKPGIVTAENPRTGAYKKMIETGRDLPNSLVRIVVADTGPGIPAAERDKLFLPYYSTKGRGSGLGLAIVRRIVAEHGGSIDVTDNVPTGTRFMIELPA